MDFTLTGLRLLGGVRGGESSLLGASGVALDGTIAYVAAQWAGLRVVDVSDAAQPGEIGSLATPSVARGWLLVRASRMWPRRAQVWRLWM